MDTEQSDLLELLGTTLKDAIYTEYISTDTADTFIIFIVTE